MSQPAFYYPVTLVLPGIPGFNTNAPLIQALPLDTTSVAAILAQDAGEKSQGLYVDDGDMWRYALPYIPLCSAGVLAQSLTIYVDPTTSTTAPAGSTVYRNGTLQVGLNIDPGKVVYTVLSPSSSGGGGSYILPPATGTSLGGVIVPTGSNIVVDSQGRIDLQPSLINSINAKIASVVTSGSGTSLIGSVASGVVTLKSLRATNALTMTDSGTGTLTLDVPIATTSTPGAVKAGTGLSVAGDGTLSVTSAGPTTLTGDVTGSGTGSIATSLSNTGVVAGTYTKVTVDAKGRVSTGASLASSDVTTALGYTPYNGATNPSGFLTANQTITVSGDATGSGSTAITLALANSGVTAGTYTKVTVDAKGRVTAGANPTTLAGYGITDGLSNTGGSVTGTLTFSGGATVTGLPTPSASGDATNKSYVDAQIASVAQSVSWKANAQAASTSNLTLSGTQTIDGYAAQVGDRVLVKNQTTASQNGVYVVAAGAWARATDADIGSEVKGMAILVINGTVNALSQWVNTNTTAPVIGTDAITYTMLQGSGSTYTAGTGLTLTSNQFSITSTGVSAGTYTKVTVNAQGQVTTGASLTGSDVNTALGYTAYNGATNPSGFLTTNQAITLSGDVTGSGSTAITATLANSGVTAGTYTKVTVDAKGRVTVGAALASSDVTTALTYTPVNKAGDTLNGTINWAATVSITAAATTDLGGAASNSITVTGNTTITALGTASAGAMRWVTFAGTPVLTYNAISLILPTSANITAAAGDSAIFMSLGGGNWRCTGYTRADGTPLAGSTTSDPTKLPLAGGTMSGALNLAPLTSLASAATVNIGAAGANDISITGNVTITAFDTIASGAHRSLVFGGALTLTHNGTSLILPGSANITTAAGDVAHFVSLGSGNWRCVNYMKANGQPVASSLSGLTLVNPTITNFTESGQNPAAGSAFTVDLTQGTDFEFTTNANATITLPSPVAGKSYTVCVIYGGAHTVTFAGGGTIKYAGGVAPTATSVSGQRDYYLCKCDRTGTFTSVFDGGRNF